jgi:hypothetical protein
MDEDTARWLEAFAHRRRALRPDFDAADFALSSDEARTAARIVWRRRVLNEMLSVDLARHLHRAAVHRDEVDPLLHSAFMRLEEDEATHVELASAVLARLGDETLPEASSLPVRQERAEMVFTRAVLTGLCVCETVSASRFAAVREHTDLPIFRACIEVFHRDELTHAELGFVLLPLALERLRSSLARPAADALVFDELRATMAHLDLVVGLDLERNGGPPPPRPQPAQNPGVVEPAVDARAFYRALHDEVVPRLSALGLPAKNAWELRHARVVEV